MKKELNSSNLAQLLLRILFVTFHPKLQKIEIAKQHEESFPTLLGHVGCYILFKSKIILLKRLLFFLKFLNP